MATFDEIVLDISLVEVAESLHAKFYLYELNFAPSGVSVVAFSVDDTPGRMHNLDEFQDRTNSIGNASDVLGCTKAALRVPLAVTRLTVYRQLHIVELHLLPFRSQARRVIVRPGEDEPRWGARIFVASVCSNRDVLAIYLSDFHRFRNNLANIARQDLV